MADDIGHAEALVRVELKHLRNEILELRREEVCRLALGVELPEKICPVCSKELVVCVIWVSAGERRVTCQKDEENNSTSEKIDHISLVLFSTMNFWCHVALGTEMSVEESRSIATFERSDEAEISDLQIEVFIKQDVFGLQVSVCNSVGMHVMKTLEELLEVEAADLFAEGSSVENVVKKLSTLDKLKHHKGDIDLSAVCLGPDSSLSGVIDINHVSVVKTLDYINFVSE